MSFNPNLFPRNDCRAGVIVATLLATLLAMRSIVHADPTLLNVFANSGVGAETTPIYVTAGANGNVTVVDPFLGQLAGNVYAPDGNYRFTLLLPTGEMGLSNGAAFGVTAADGSVYVADHSAGVAVFSPTGVQQRIIAGGVVQQPSGIAVTDSLVYVTNRTSIAIYTTGGTSVGTFGSVGSGPGQFNIPNGIALDSTATNLYLADQTNNRIDVFSSGGVYETNFGSAAGAGQLNKPFSVSVSGTGLVYVADAAPGVKVYSTGGGYLWTFATTVNGSTLQPQTASVSSTGLIYIAGATTAAGSAAVYRYFDPAAWSAGTNTFTNASTGPTSVAAGAGQLLGTTLALKSNMGLVVGNSTSIINGGTLSVIGGSLNTPSLVVDGASGGANFTMFSGTLATASIAVTGGGVADFAGAAIATGVDGAITVSGAASQFKVEQGAVISASALTNIGGQIVAGTNADLIIYNNVTNGGVVNLAGGELDVRGSLTNVAGSTLQGSGTLSTTSGLANTGALKLAGPSNVLGNVANSGSIEISGGNQPTIFFGDITNTGTITIDAGAAATFEGNLTGNPATAGAINVQANATANLTGANAVLVAGGLNLAGVTGAWTGELDLGSNDLIVHNGIAARIIDQIKQDERAGSTGGIASATIAGTTLAVVANDNGAGGIRFSTFDDVPVTAADVLVKDTLIGDANLDGAVNVADLGVLATNYGVTAGATWWQGDSNYDGAVNVADLGALATHYGQAIASGQLAQPSATIASVPEPASFASITAGAVLALGQRQGRRKLKK